MKKVQYQNLHYVGSFSTLQTQGNTRYGAISLNKRQNELYSRLLKGLSLYDKDTLYDMNSRTKNGIDKRHIKAQNLLNVWKQELMINMSNTIFEAYDIKENITIKNEDGVNETAKIKLSELFNQPDPNFTCTLSFKDLGINKGKIIEKFLEARLLPEDFMELS